MDEYYERVRYKQRWEEEEEKVEKEIKEKGIEWTDEMIREQHKYTDRGSTAGYVEYLKKIIKDHDDEQAAAKLRGPPEDPIGKLNVIQWKQDHEKKTGAAGLKVPLLYRAGKQNIICDDAYWRKMLGKCVYRKHYPELKQEGPFRLHNGDTYYGEIIDGAIGRWGTLITLRGDIYEGEFKFYIPAVRGVFLTKDKLFYEGPVFFDPKDFSLLQNWYYENLDISDLIQKNIDYREILQKNVESRLKTFDECVIAECDGFGRIMTQSKKGEQETYRSKEWFWYIKVETEVISMGQCPDGWMVRINKLGVHQGVDSTQHEKGREKAIMTDGQIAEIDTEPGSSHGRMTQYLPDGKVGECSLQYGKRTNGFSTVVYPSGDTYEGYWKQSYDHLFSDCQFLDGRRYLGELNYHLREGNGRYKRPNGVVYRGKFLKGNKHGKGEYVLLNGCTITVETEVGYITKHLSTRRHTRVSRVTQQEDGKYRLDYEDGAYYIGQINEKTQQREGYGLYVHKHKDYWYQGQWQKDIEHGTG